MNGADDREIRQAVRAAVLCVDARWAAQYSERFAVELLDELMKAGWTVARKDGIPPAIATG